MKQPMALIILDGWGYREDTQDNAIAAAQTPHWDRLWASYPHTLLEASGPAVGLPPHQIGNSEVGHVHMGAGRVVPQELSRIQRAMEHPEVMDPTLSPILASVQSTGGAIHLIGLTSTGGVHAHTDHLQRMAQHIATRCPNNPCLIHAITDGRDVPPQSAISMLQKLEACTAPYPNLWISSMVGRYYAMDRDQRWDRIQRAYDLWTQGKATRTAHHVTEAVHLAYAAGETDEFIQPTQLLHPQSQPIRDGDLLLCMNFRADRARQWVQAFVLEDFPGFSRAVRPRLQEVVTLTTYDRSLPVSVLFPSRPLDHVLGHCVAEAKYRQLRLAETEKYAHVTFFMNGGRELPFPGEERILIPSPAVATYDLQPQMSATAVTDALVHAINNQHHPLIICNYANADMVGHTGNFEATIQAIETLDACLGRVTQALHHNNMMGIVTADHGNAEILFDHEHQQPHTAHTQALVPCLCIGNHIKALRPQGALTDIAPTILTLMGLETPLEMTGNPLFQCIKDG